MLYPANYRERFNTSRFTHQDKTFYAFLESIQTDLEHGINSAPLNQRGWVLQEGILSRRMVHFCKKQLIWECMTDISSEDGLVALNKDHLRRPFAPSTISDRQGLYAEWDAVVRDYSGRLLSQAKDKTLALAGATTHFAHLLCDEPLLGLWRDDLHTGLLWRATEPRGRVNAAELKSIPSWSWMVIDGPVTFDTKYQMALRNPENIKMAMQVKEVFVKWKGEELTSEVTQACLIVSGRLIPFKPSSRPIGDIWWDSPSRPDGNMFLLLVAQVKKRLEQIANGNWIFRSRAHFLILSETSKKDVYSRVGMGVAHDSEEIGGHFADQSEETIVLV
ncbi:hypothetical protein CEP54_015599 [Fusarium duplospermum]|uniref:Heterokaryon incompatibility protein n=1 Tax=Fusarium duplospermum TaxID=1325734 RepID=A0A428NMR9_9HYPO|nr:hypothetical protein CEP54_015599 [Fusarium duplospermum]